MRTVEGVVGLMLTVGYTLDQSLALLTPSVVMRQPPRTPTPPRPSRYHECGKHVSRLSYKAASQWIIVCLMSEHPIIKISEHG